MSARSTSASIFLDRPFCRAGRYIYGRSGPPPKTLPLTVPKHGHICHMPTSVMCLHLSCAYICHTPTLPLAPRPRRRRGGRLAPDRRSDRPDAQARRSDGPALQSRQRYRAHLEERPNASSRPDDKRAIQSRQETASLKIRMLFRIRNANARSSATTKEKVDPGPLHWAL